MAAKDPATQPPFVPAPYTDVKPVAGSTGAVAPETEQPVATPGVDKPLPKGTPEPVAVPADEFGQPATLAAPVPATEVTTADEIKPPAKQTPVRQTTPKQAPVKQAKQTPAKASTARGTSRR